ncbi:MAG: N-acetylmuramoyl-L-alanine amidase [Thermoleophilia bacterium]|nr:N-acetylmuramoyl-L-alanine amidase [Thermoleophilia bacterium]
MALLLVSAAAVSAQTPGFPDVGKSLPSYDAIQFLSGAGIISGYKDGNFGPGDTLKRAQATKMLVLWKEVFPVTKGNTFPDVDETYRSYIETAVAQGWITGFSNGRFKPYSTLTREQMAIIMVRAMDWEDTAQELSTAQIDEALSAFADQADISAVARPYVAVAVSEGLFGGSDGRLLPKEGITRGQFCLVVFRAELKLRTLITEVQASCDYPDKTRVVVDLSRAPGPVTASATADGLLNIDYQDGVVDGTLSRTFISPEVTGVSCRQFNYTPRTVRISLDLGRFQKYRVMSLVSSDGHGYRIVVDIYRRTTGPEGDGGPLICVDPGHGGKDSGAVGTTKAKEKDVNLAISLMLAQNLRQAGLQVMMTRSDDSYPDLHYRASLANEACASLFVSIHNNASGDPAAVGTETFYWGTPEECSPEGKLLAETIQRNLVAAIRSVDRGARTHWYNLVVLAETLMPAALVEVGFMTNSAEEAKLLSAAYQQAAAQGITAGILEYLGWSTTVYSTES